MSIDPEALVVRQHQDIWSRGKLEAISEIFAPTFVGHHPGRPDWIGPNGVREAVNAIRTAFPDFSESIEDIIVNGDKVVTRFTASGTHLGVFRDLAPTGRRVAIEEIGSVAAFLASGAGAPLSGSVVYADNGFHTMA